MRTWVVIYSKNNQRARLWLNAGNAGKARAQFGKIVPGAQILKCYDVSAEGVSVPLRAKDQDSYIGFLHRTGQLTANTSGIV